MARNIFAPAPKPKSVLGYHRLLSSSAGVRCSPLCLGAMNFGDAWEAMLGPCDKDTSMKMLDTFYEAGGNFIDTANNYQDEQSEEWLGEWMEKRGNRDQIVLATKYTTGFRTHHENELQSNFQGNHAKSLHVSVNASLKKLKTDYIDLLYLHWWDYSTSVEEVMQSLNVLVKQGKVIYLGISDTPAWIVSKANEYARQNGLRGFSVYQGKWNAADRDMEREIIPMCESEGMGICPWSALGGGAFKTTEQRKNAESGRGKMEMSENQQKVSAALEKIADKKGTVITSIALAYIMHKYPRVFPIVGGRKPEHLKGNIEALKIQLSDEELEEIEDSAPFDVGFPTNFAWRGETKHSLRNKVEDIGLVKANAHLDTADKPGPIKPRSE